MPEADSGARLCSPEHRVIERSGLAGDGTLLVRISVGTPPNLPDLLQFCSAAIESVAGRCPSLLEGARTPSALPRRGAARDPASQTHRPCRTTARFRTQISGANGGRRAPSAVASRAQAGQSALTRTAPQAPACDGANEWEIARAGSTSFSTSGCQWGPSAGFTGTGTT